jgi:hypothetical protein
LTATDSSTIDFTVVGTDVTAVVLISAFPGNSVQAAVDGLYVADLCTQLKALAVLVGNVDGTNDSAVIYDLSADACVRTTPRNLLCGAINGLTVVAPTVTSVIPISNGAGACGTTTLCTLLNVLDTATDTEVPATADVVYIRTDGTCGRAPLPAGGAVNCAAISAVFTASAGLIPSTSGIMVTDGITCVRVTMPTPCTLTNVGVTGIVGNAAGDLVPGRLAFKARSRVGGLADTLDPANEDILFVNNAAGNAAITLATPSACEPNIVHVKQTNNSTANSITVTPASGTLDGGANHIFGNTGSTRAENRTFFFDGTNWFIL